MFEAFLADARFPCKCCTNNSEMFFCNSSFTGEVSTVVNLKRWEHADVRLLITTHANNKHLFDGKAPNKDAFEKNSRTLYNYAPINVKPEGGVGGGGGFGQPMGI